MKHERTFDRALVGRIIERQIPRTESIRNVSGLGHAIRASRDTIYRAQRGDETISLNTLNRIEHALRLPYETLSTAAAHDVEGLVEIGVSAELVAWIRNEMGKSAGGAANDAKAI